jgi:DNA-binding IclR family transcriptional regulator
MSVSSPAVRRVVAVLNFFADHPGQAFTLTDLVRALRLSRATCHGLLAGLVEAGYLYRTSDKSYLLGPALVAIGEVAKANYSPLQAAQPEMRSLADEFDAICSITFRERREVVVRERAAAVSHLGYSVPRGTRLPLGVQFASLFFVWSTAAEIKTWLDDIDPAPTDEQSEDMRSGIAYLRDHGTLFGVRNLRSDIANQAPTEPGAQDWLHGERYSNAPVRPVFAIDPDEQYPLGFVQAPVLDARRRVAFVIGLQGFNRLYSGDEVLRIGKRVREAADRIGTFIAHGSATRG